MVSVKKIIYFLFACDEKHTVRFLSKYRSFLEENRNFPWSFIKRSKKFFRKNKKLICLTDKNKLLIWQCFCKNSVYEQILPIVLFGILKYPKEKVSLFLKIPPEVLSYRLEEGLSVLEEELLKVNSKTIDKKALKKEKGQMALAYCSWVAEQVLPDSIEKAQSVEKYKRIKYLLWAFFCLVFLAFFIWILSLILSPPDKVMLYHSFLNKSF